MLMCTDLANQSMPTCLLIHILDGAQIGELIPKSWQHGCDFLMAAHNTFQVVHSSVDNRFPLSHKPVHICP